MAVFQDFDWNSSVRDKGNNVAEFKKINIFYGRNYSGKTTLSRIFRALETGTISEKYGFPEFHMSLNGGTSLNQNSLTKHNQTFRVFNEDFVKENLRFIVDNESTINSFAVLGSDNTKIEEEIARHEIEVGSEKSKSGLIGNMIDAEVVFNQAKKVYDDKQFTIDDKLRTKARNIEKNITLSEGNRYQINHIKKDIDTVTSKNYTPITTEIADEYHKLLKEEPKKKIDESELFNLKYSTLMNETKKLVEKKIQASEPIQELLKDAVLATWVRTGREHHEGKRTKCAFCGNDLPMDLWDKLDRHFNKESEELRSAIDELIKDVETEKNRISNILKINKSDFYSNFSSDLEELEEHFSVQSDAYRNALDSIKKQLEKRKEDIFNSLPFVEPVSVEHSLNSIRASFEEYRKKSNDTTASLSAQQSQAHTKLRLYEIYNFENDIKYSNECEALKNAKNSMDKAEESYEKAQRIVRDKLDLITRLKAQLKDESKGADKVNKYLNNFFGHQSLSLKAIRNEFDDSTSSYRFEVTRNNTKAYYLSEGECGLIAFCYFVAKLEDVETKGTQPIIWIDDPVSSLDANHIFFAYSLINSEITTPEKFDQNGKINERERFKQLFISTHNLDFLKYLKQLPGALNKNSSQYFMINRANHLSNISIMPKYLKDYVTEFNYLFHQIYKCAQAQLSCDENHDCFYNFGNNARKFLESYLYFKYPNAQDKDDKLCRFFGDDVLASALANRINNEYSHLAGLFERSMLPIDVPEMKATAIFILKKIEEKDPEQYSAFLQSIGEGAVQVQDAPNKP